MKIRSLFLIMVVCCLFFATTIEAKKPTPSPDPLVVKVELLEQKVDDLTRCLTVLQDQVTSLTQYVIDIQLIPGPQGKAGAVGPQGEPGLPTQHGAGNIAFIYFGSQFDGTNSFFCYLLRNDGTVWKGKREDIPSYIPEEGEWGQVPIPVSDIVSWNFHSFLDKDGNFWYINTSGGAGAAWYNYGPLP